MIKIYAKEIEDGISEMVQANASIAYACPLSIANPTEDEKSRIEASLKSEASSNKGQKDLYYVDSVLVTTCWNRNDDVFNKSEVWAARSTPEDKPFNIEHDEHDIIGHITGNWIINNSGEIIPDETSEEELPDTYHIVTSSVMYKHWTDPKLIARTKELIEQIEAGKKFVSMECLFTDFDYALASDSGQMRTLGRNEESAFLTKHLRAYGGTGVYQGFKIGRMLKNIAFCGHGLVDKPANPSSIIFDKYNPFVAPTEGSLAIFESSQAAQQSVLSKEETEMADNLDFYKNQVSELKASVNTLSQEKKELEAQLTEAGAKEYDAKIAELQVTIAEKDETIEAQVTESEALATELTETKTKLEEAEAKVVEVEQAKAELDAQLAQIEAEKVRASRISQLVEAGLETEEAEAAVEKFAELSDDQFEAIALMVAPKDKKDKKEKKEEAIKEEAAKKEEANMPPALKEALDKKKKKEGEAMNPTSMPPKRSMNSLEEDDITQDDAEAAAEEEIFDEVEASDEVALSANDEGSEDEFESTRAALSDLIANKYLKVN
jgi:hypothetical protein